MKPSYTKNETILKLTDISLSFGEQKILRDINLEIKDIQRPNQIQGQIEGLIAPSGMGKTQLLKIIAGLQKPSTGTVEIDEKLRPVHVGDVGVVQQSYPLLNHETVYNNLHIAGKLSPMNFSEIDIKERIDYYLAQFELTDKANEYPGRLSGGQRQRIAIAQQLLCSEHFLLLDEPFSGLDVVSIDIVSEMLVKISNVHELNTIIIVSHDISSTAAIADTIYLLGKDKDETGKLIPGAYIKTTYDLLERELCWDPNIRNEPKFLDFTKEVRNEFKNLC